MIYKKLSAFLLLSLATITPLQNSFGFSFKFSSDDEKRTYLYSVGSSTISPFMSTMSEEFSRTENLRNIDTKTPHVESAGTRNGFISFCEGVGYKYPDFVSASRPIDKSEIENCNKNNVNEIVEIKIGYDGIIIGNFKGSQKIKLSEEQIFLALAEKVLDKNTGHLIKNPYQKWSEIDSSLPKKDILVYGPPTSSGTRDVFIDLVMEDVCFKKKEFIEEYKDYESRKEQCAKIRSDGRFVESGENDNLIVQNLKNNPDSFGILGFNFLVVNKDIIQAAKINNIEPTFESISSKKYRLSRPLFVYFKREHLDLMPRMRDFIKEIISTETIGRKGYLLHSGLVALSNSEVKEVREKTLSQL
jgi:phosphate transport system substrate-binding protein